MSFGKRFDEALLLASELHRSQLRKQSQIPYITHLLAVAAIVGENGGSEDEVIAALLHDAVEDQGGSKTLERIRVQFGEKVAMIVEQCSDTDQTPKPPWKERKLAYIQGVAHKDPSSLLVSVADKIHNSRSILANLRVQGEETWNRFSGGKEGTRWYYRSLSNEFKHFFPGELADELERIVAQIEELSSPV